MADRALDATVAQGVFHASFNCLWCGRPNTTRTPDDLEGWAQLCSDCVGKAQDNEFLRYRLRDGLQRRNRAVAQMAREADEMKAYYGARAGEYDEFYEGLGWPPVERAVFLSDLDAAALWLDALPLSGEIVELAAGTGWWSTLLAQKGELWMYDVAEEVLDRARQRLVAHGLRAHLHLRDAWAEPDRQVDALFCGAWLTHVPSARLAEFLAICRRWLKPGGTFAFIDEAGGWGFTPTVDEHQLRKLKDGREFSIIKVYYEPEDLDAALRAAGFSDIEVHKTSRFLILGQARA